MKSSMFVYVFLALAAVLLSGSDPTEAGTAFLAFDPGPPDGGGGEWG